jgi:hypothetical protein
MTEKPIRTYQLDVSRIQDLDDVKKILNGLTLRINTDDEFYEDVKDLFTTEVVPQGYAKLLQAVGDEEVAKMSYEEMKEKISELGLLNDEES